MHGAINVKFVIRCWVCGKNVPSHYYLCSNNSNDVHGVSLSRTATRCVDGLALPEQRIRNQSCTVWCTVHDHSRSTDVRDTAVVVCLCVKGWHWILPN